MPEIQCVYRSTHPAVQEWEHDRARRKQEADEAVCAFLRELDTHDAANPLVEVQTHTWGPSWWLAGVHGKEAPGPLWREAEPGLWVPNRRTKAGKELGARVEGISFKWKRAPGMPRSLSVPAGQGTNRMIWPVVELLGGGYWCAWKVSAAQVEASSSFDPALWERGKLSEYWAAKEAEMEKAGA